MKTQMLPLGATPPPPLVLRLHLQLLRLYHHKAVDSELSFNEPPRWPLSLVTSTLGLFLWFLKSPLCLLFQAGASR